MTKAEMNFGNIHVLIEDDKSNTKKLTKLCYSTLLDLIPEAKLVAKEERQQMLENMKLIKSNAEFDGCDECDNGDECPHSREIMKKTDGLYI